MAKRNKVKISPGDVAFRAILMVILFIYTISIFFIVGWGFMNSFKEELHFETFNALSFPKLPIRPENAKDYSASWAFGNYLTVLKHFNYEKSLSYVSIFSENVSAQVNAGIFQMLLNTLYMAIICSAAQVVVCYTTAYLAAKYKFKFSGFLYGLAIAMMSIPIVGSTPSIIDVLMDLGLYSNYLGMLVMRASFGGMYFLVFYAFFEGLPDSYTEAAEIDGASQMGIYLKIILPMGVKMLGTVVLLLFVHNWNDYSMAFIYMPTIPTLAFGVYQLAHGGNPMFDGLVYKIAGCMILVIPTSILFLCAKDKIMGNISAGGLKG